MSIPAEGTGGATTSKQSHAGLVQGTESRPVGCPGESEEMKLKRRGVGAGLCIGLTGF